MSSSKDRILVEVAGGTMALTFNRPDKLNAIDARMAREFMDAITLAGSDPQVRVLLLQGAGRAFCAGRDVTAAPTDEDLVGVQAVAEALVALPKPVVAAVHGWTGGAGLEWMLDADIVVAAEGSRFRFPEAQLGVFVTGGVTATLTAAVGVARAKALTLLGEEFGAAQAQAWGLVWQVVPDADLGITARAVCERLARLEPQVASRFKKVFNEVGMAQFQRALELETAAQRGLQG